MKLEFGAESGNVMHESNKLLHGDKKAAAQNRLEKQNDLLEWLNFKPGQRWGKACDCQTAVQWTIRITLTS